MTLLVIAHILDPLEQSPFWAATMGTEVEKCKNYWWQNVLGISNFVALDKNVSVK